MQLSQEKERYEEVLGKSRFAEISQRFEQITDQQKPFYSIQFAFYMRS